MKNIEFILPDFALMVTEICKKEKNRPRIIFSYKSFDDELQLLGSVIKYCSLKNITIVVLGNIKNGLNYDLDSELYSVNEVELIAEAIKKRVDKFEFVTIISHFDRACENCGIKLNENPSFDDSHYSMMYYKNGGSNFNMTENYKLVINKELKINTN
jgi:hypothetical protein